MKLSLVPMLLTGESISAAVRQALGENRLKDAADILMKEYGLSCVEAGDLLDVSMCDCKQNDAKRLGWSDKGRNLFLDSSRRAATTKLPITMTEWIRHHHTCSRSIPKN